MDSNINKHIQEWTNPPFDDVTIKEIRDLIEKNDRNELADRFYRTLEFGTGGLRGVIGAGLNRMNIYTVGMATQGLANYMLNTASNGKGAVIARDSRINSDIFATETACILAANGIPVYFFRDITPTPLASFAIRELKAQAGVVITASHNPPEYNGYKVYWDDGGQIVPPHDNRIIAEVELISSPGDVKKINFDEAVSSGLIKIIDDEIINSYIKKLEDVMLEPCKNNKVSIVYTPLHGTGYNVVPRVLSHFGFNNLAIVEEQSTPDGRFPTVKSPNPEERDAMNMALDLATKKGADIVLATDPDADRMGVGFKNSSGSYDLINGNQIGSMLAAYVIARRRESGNLPADGVIIKTIVTTEMQREIAVNAGCAVEDVLTGFKWIAASMKRHEETDKKPFIFGGEESYGYLPVPFVRDKDAVSSILFFAEMTSWLNAKGQSLQEFLDSLYIANGLHHDDLLSLTLKGMDGQERIARIMNTFRTNPPSELAGMIITSIRDIKNLITIDLKHNKKTSIDNLPSSDVIQLILDNGSRVTLRPSGTEPKIKFYFNVCKKVERDTLHSGKIELKQMVQELKDDLLKKVEKIS